MILYTAHPRHCSFACKNVQMVDVICPPLSISSIVVSLWLAGCLAKSTLIGWREYYGGGGVGVDKHLCGAQQTRAFDPMLFQYWPTTSPCQHWNNIESSLRVCWKSCPHFDTRVPSVSGRNRQHSALCNDFIHLPRCRAKANSSNCLHEIKSNCSSCLLEIKSNSSNCLLEVKNKK